MKRSINLWQFLGFAVTTLGGTILHFLYEWLGEAAWIAPFSGVNESTWEHMKLLFWPMFIFAIIERLFFKGIDNFWCVKLKGIILGISLIPVLFYMYNGVIGKSPDWINIAIFFISAAIAFIYESIQLKQSKPCILRSSISFYLLCFIGILFVIFTFFTPTIGIFRDPITYSYGI